MRAAIDPSTFPEPLRPLAAKVRDGVRLDAADAELCLETPLVLHLGRLAEQRGLYLSLSSEVAPEHREYERASTTVMNAFVGPTMEGYLRRLERELASHGCERLHDTPRGLFRAA